MLSFSPSQRLLAFRLIVLLVIVGTAAPGYDAVAQRMDDGSLLLYPELILEGWLPYRDSEPLMARLTRISICVATSVA